MEILQIITSNKNNQKSPSSIIDTFPMPPAASTVPLGHTGDGRNHLWVKSCTSWTLWIVLRPGS